MVHPFVIMFTFTAKQEASDITQLHLLWMNLFTISLSTVFAYLMFIAVEGPFSQVSRLLITSSTRNVSHVKNKFNYTHTSTKRERERERE